MKTSKFGIDFILGFEGFIPFWYDDLQKGTKTEITNFDNVKGTPTIGYGFTKYVVPLKLGQKMTKTEARNIFEKVIKKYEERARNLVNVPLTQKQFDVVVSWLYNTNRTNSDLFKFINNQDWNGLKNFWENKYITSKGEVLNGLIRRRKEESDVFQKELSNPNKLDVKKNF